MTTLTIQSKVVRYKDTGEQKAIVSLDLDDEGVWLSPGQAYEQGIQLIKAAYSAQTDLVMINLLVSELGIDLDRAQDFVALLREQVVNVKIDQSET